MTKIPGTNLAEQKALTDELYRAIQNLNNEKTLISYYNPPNQKSKRKK